MVLLYSSAQWALRRRAWSVTILLLCFAWLTLSPQAARAQNIVSSDDTNYTPIASSSTPAHAAHYAWFGNTAHFKEWRITNGYGQIVRQGDDFVEVEWQSTGFSMISYFTTEDDFGNSYPEGWEQESLQLNVAPCAPLPGYSRATAVFLGEFNQCPQTTPTQYINLVSCYYNDFDVIRPQWPSGQPSPDVFYSFRLLQESVVEINTCGSDFNTYLHLLSSSPLFTEIASNNDAGAGTPCPGQTSFIRQTLYPGTYYIVAEGNGYASGNLALSLHVIPQVSYMPQLTVSAAGQVLTGLEVDLLPGNSLTLSATQTAAGTNTYSWAASIGPAPSPANGSSITISPAYNTTYTLTCTYTSPCGVTTTLQRRIRVRVTENRNYITTRQPQVAGKTNPDEVESLSTPTVRAQTLYYDGLGRGEQRVARQQSPLGLDLNTPITYDEMGRPAVSYLPYAAGTTGAFKTNAVAVQQAFYAASTTGDNIANDAEPASQTVYDGTPSGQIREQGAPGAAWQPGTGHTSKFQQRTNRANEVRLWNYIPSSGQCTTDGYYPAGTLQVRESRDEHDLLVTEYTNSEGRLVLKKVSPSAIVICNLQQEGQGNLVISVPANSGLLINGIQEATWGTGTGSLSNCDSFVFDPVHQSDATPWVRALAAASLNAPSPSISIPVDWQQLGPDPYSGQSKVLRVKATCVLPSSSDDVLTYYVFDDLNRLIAVISPEGSARVPASGTFVADANFLGKWAFSYTYDSRGRVTKKYVPGGGYTWYVYNQRDQVVLSTQQYSGQPQSGDEWLYTKYDVLGRPIATGSYYNWTYATQSDLQTAADALAAWEDLASDPNNASLISYTSDHSFPVLTTNSSYQELTRTFYDSYQFAALQGKSFQPISYSYPGELIDMVVPASEQRTEVAGLVTGQQDFVSSTGGVLTTTLFYDNKGRQIQSLADLDGGGTEQVTTRYTFTGQPVQIHTRHAYTAVANTFPHTFYEERKYDAGGRLIRIWTKADTQEKVLLAKSDYNELGQLVDKKLHSTDWIESVPTLREKANPEFLQSVDYRYNIRGWLTNINNRELSNNLNDRFNDADPNQDDLTKVDQDLFGFEIKYDKGQELLNATSPLGSPQFNGNISEVLWHTRGQTSLQKLRGYAYTYDKLNRVSDAAYRTRENGSWGLYTTDYSVSGTDYDRNGNIQHLNRKGDGAVAGQPAQLDQLSYYYDPSNPNRLLAVDDAAPLTNATGTGTTPTHDFEDNGIKYSGPTGTGQAEYEYDSRGNLIKDRNKGIVNIIYNILNKPLWIQLTGSRYIQYVYSGTGTKLSRTTWEWNGTTYDIHTTNYVSNCVYVDGVLQFAPTPEGRLLYNNSGSGYTWKYEYQLKDHLGNLRFAFRNDYQNMAQRTATMEPVNQQREEKDFDHVAETRMLDATRARTGSYVARLNAAEGRRVGPSIRWNVQAGDSIYTEVYGRYERKATTGKWLKRGVLVTGTAVAADTRQPTDESKVPASRRRLIPVVGASVGITVPNLLPSHREELPKAFLRVDLYNADSQLIAQRIQLLERTAADTWQQLSTGLRTDSAGYVIVTLINESSESAYFDDLVLRPVDPREFQENHYDPWGLNLVGIEDAGAPDSKFQFNSKEKQDAFGLQWTDYGARMYNMQLGRWNSVDPVSEQYWSSSPFVYVANNPINSIDPDGRTIFDKNDQQIHLDFELNEEKMSISNPADMATVKTLINTFFYSPIGSKRVKEMMESEDKYKIIVSDKIGIIVDEKGRYGQVDGATSINQDHDYAAIIMLFNTTKKFDGNFSNTSQFDFVEKYEDRYIRLADDKTKQNLPNFNESNFNAREKDRSTMRNVEELSASDNLIYNEIKARSSVSLEFGRITTLLHEIVHAYGFPKEGRTYSTEVQAYKERYHKERKYEGEKP